MTQVNLLPSEVQERTRVRRQTLFVASAAAAVVGLLVLVFVVQLARLTKANDELAAQQQTNTELGGQIADLQQFADLQQKVADKEALVASTLNGRILWSGVLRDVSLVIPGDMWLTNLTGSLDTTALAVPGGTSQAGGTTVAPALIGSVQFQGTSFSRPVLAKWLTRLEEVEGWVNPWISSSSRASNESVEITFSGSVDLTVDATEKGRRS
jgi:Tfp pilus assembly protein PilN